MKLRDSNIAIIHDWFLKNSFGGAEKVSFLIDQFLEKDYSKPDLFSLVSNIKKSLKNKKTRKTIKGGAPQDMRNLYKKSIDEYKKKLEDYNKLKKYCPNPVINKGNVPAIATFIKMILSHQHHLPLIEFLM